MSYLVCISCIIFVEKYTIGFLERPTLLNNTHRHHYLSSRLPDEIIISIACAIGILLCAFIFFLIYHFRNEKSLRRTLLATRILATRGINNLKSVRQRKENVILVDDVVVVVCLESSLSKRYRSESKETFE